ncbi:MAG: hypothetical protein DRP54_00370 [Spirochaetes bacterium]|nr:MAG: hypothetical protein DRP54_00370 [Spirochaetota bacterium]
MTIEDIAVSEGIWGHPNLENSDIVLKTEIRIFRNVEGFPFSHKLKKNEKKQLFGEIINTVSDLPRFKGAAIFDLNSIEQDEREILYERNIIKSKLPIDSSLILSSDLLNYVIIGNYNHIECAGTVPGAGLYEAYKSSSEIITELSVNYNFLYSNEFGYLSAFPGYSGCGMEVSTTVHLPGLIKSGKINEITIELEKRGAGLRSSWIDDFYEIFNKYSIGMNEKELYLNSRDVIELIITAEKEAREMEYKRNKVFIEDKVWRSYSILTSARLLSILEALELLSNVRLGISLGIIRFLNIKQVNLLLNYIQNYHLKRRFKFTDIKNIDEVRASFLRDYLKEVI